MKYPEITNRDINFTSGEMLTYLWHLKYNWLCTQVPQTNLIKLLYRFFSHLHIRLASGTLFHIIKNYWALLHCFHLHVYQPAVPPTWDQYPGFN